MPRSPLHRSWRLPACLIAGMLPALLQAQDVEQSTFRDNGMGVDWCAATNRIAYDRKEASGYYGLRLVDAQGGGDVALSERVPGLPRRTVGSPAWYPDGSFLVATVEKPRHPGSAIDATPGFGGYSDLWAIAADGSWCSPLTEVDDDADHGTIGGHFSRDGRHLAWTERTHAVNILDPQVMCGAWVVKVADVELRDGRPRLTHELTINPGGKPCFNEAYGFSPDGTRLIFCSSWNQGSVWSSQINTCDLRGGDLVQLTRLGYNEHAVYRPDGSAILWMSTCRSTLGGTDWWMMDADGSHPRRLTTFNEPGSPMCSGQPQWAGLVTFSPDGSSVLGGVERDLLSMDAWIAGLRLFPGRPGTGPARVLDHPADLGRTGLPGAPATTPDLPVPEPTGASAPAPAAGAPAAPGAEPPGWLVRLDLQALTAGRIGAWLSDLQRDAHIRARLSLAQSATGIDLLHDLSSVLLWGPDLAPGEIVASARGRFQRDRLETLALAAPGGVIAALAGERVMIVPGGVQSRDVLACLLRGDGRLVVGSYRPSLLAALPAAAEPEAGRFPAALAADAAAGPPILRVALADPGRWRGVPAQLELLHQIIGVQLVVEQLQDDLRIRVALVLTDRDLAIRYGSIAKAVLELATLEPHVRVDPVLSALVASAALSRHGARLDLSASLPIDLAIKAWTPGIIAAAAGGDRH